MPSLSRIKQEHEGAIIFVDCRAVSPSDTTPAPPDNDDIASSSIISDENKKDETKRNIAVSLTDDRYKEIMIEYWERLWVCGESSNENGYSLSDNRKDLVQEIYDRLKSDVENSGGILIRKFKKGGDHPASTEDALYKINADLYRGKTDYNKSVYSKNRNRRTSAVKELGSAASSNETEEGNNEATVPTSPSAPEDGPTKIPAPPTNDKDLIVSLEVPKYQQIIAMYVEALLIGELKQTFRTIALEQLRTVKLSGGKIFKVKKRGMHPIGVGDDEAMEKITRDLRKKLAKARKSQAKIEVLNMKENDEYKSEIMGWAKTLVNENEATSKAEKIGAALLEQFEGSGVMHFFMHYTDEGSISSSEALEKITKDIKEQARELRNESYNSPTVIKVDSFQDTVISRTRTKRKSTGNSTIQCTPREYMASYVRDILPEHGWEVKRRTIKGLDYQVAERCGTENDQGGPCKLFDFDQIIEFAYRSGLYETHVVGTEKGREYLEKAGILKEPYSIFSKSEPKRKRKKRRKHKQEQTVGLKSESGDGLSMKGEISNGTKDHPSNLEGNGLDIDDSGADGNTDESETLSDDPVSSTTDTDQGSETVTRTSPGADLHALGGTPQVLMSTPGSAQSPSDGDNNGGHNMGHKSVSEVHHEPGAGNNYSPADVLASPRVMQRTELSIQARQIYKCIKGRLSSAEKCSNEGAQKSVTLQNNFYSHMKSWLMPRVRTVLESDLKDAQKALDDFHEAITDLLESGNDKREIKFYTDCCEVIMEDCKRSFLL